MSRLEQLQAAAEENGWERLETYSGPRYVRRTAATFGTVTEAIDVYLTGGERPALHHAWYTRQTPDPRARNSSAFVITDARYDADQFESLLTRFSEQG